MIGEDGLYAALVRRGMSRRTFLKFSTAMAATLALPVAFAPRIARAVEAAPRLPVVWLRGQSCSGNTEALLRAADPSTSALLLDLLSIDYHDGLMAPAGAAAELSLTSALERYPDGYIAVVEGSIPRGAGGAYCLVGGRPFGDVVREVCDGALATIAVGACAFDGGIAGAGGGVTDATGARDVVGGRAFVTLPGCPLNVDNLTATIVHYLTFKELPATDAMGRPLFAYGALVHNQCERRPHFEFGEFVLAWGDEGAQKGWCLYKMGCKGPETNANCPTVQYAEGTSWNVRAGHGCVGCTMPNFWDAMSPFYRRLPSPVPFFPNVTADGVGVLLLGSVGAIAAVHGGGMVARSKLNARSERRSAAVAAGTSDALAAPAAPLEPEATAGAAVEDVSSDATLVEETPPIAVAIDATAGGSDAVAPDPDPDPDEVA